MDERGENKDWGETEKRGIENGGKDAREDETHVMGEEI